jgi:hypothetical protein
MIGVELQVDKPRGFVKNMSLKTKTKLGDAVEVVGRKLERDSKQYAPYVHGNLRRSIKFKRMGHHGEVQATANYAHYVHGAPFHHSSRMRRTTPYFTMARDHNKKFAQTTLDNAMKRAVSESSRGV